MTTIDNTTFCLLVLGWIFSSIASVVLWIVSSELGKAARANKQLRDRLFCAEQGERFWRSMAQPTKR